jgi:phospholipid transport system substrate-binding protein
MRCCQRGREALNELNQGDGVTRVWGVVATLVSGSLANMVKSTSAAICALMLLMAAPAGAAQSSGDTPAPVEAMQQTPVQVVEGLCSALIDVMQHADQLGYDGRYARLDPVIRRVFDLPTMTKIVAGASWSGWTDDQRAAVSEAFSKFVVSTYARRFDGYSGETFVTDNSLPLANGMLVMTRLVQKTAPAVTLNYLVRQRPGAPWQIVDVFLTGSISELATRRSEFSAVIDRDGYQGLLDALKAKTNNNPEP